MIDVRRMHLVGRNPKDSFVNVSSPEGAVVSVGHDNVPVDTLHISKAIKRKAENNSLQMGQMLIQTWISRKVCEVSDRRIAVHGACRPLGSLERHVV